MTGWPPPGGNDGQPDEAQRPPTAALPVSPAGAAKADAAEEATVRLFDRPGITWLAESKQSDPGRVFRIANDSLHVSGDGFGYWRTAEVFADFRLTVQFRWGRQVLRTGQALDSGLFIHTQPPDGNSHDGGGAFMAGIEINIFQGATGDFLLIRGNDASGRLIAPRLTADVAPERDADGWPTWVRGGNAVTLSRLGRINWSRKSAAWMDVENFRGPHDIEKPRGEWNTLEIESAHDTLRVRLNGTPVNEARDPWPRSGHVLFQCEGAEITFRAARLVPINTQRER